MYIPFLDVNKSLYNSPSFHLTSSISKSNVVAFSMRHTVSFLMTKFKGHCKILKKSVKSNKNL